MDTPLITWACVVGLFLIILSVRIIHTIINGSHLHRRHIFELGSEREEVFVPGDTLKIDENDRDDIDDL